MQDSVDTFPSAHADPILDLSQFRKLKQLGQKHQKLGQELALDTPQAWELYQKVFELSCRLRAGYHRLRMANMARQCEDALVQELQTLELERFETTDQLLNEITEMAATAIGSPSVLTRYQTLLMDVV